VPAGNYRNPPIEEALCEFVFANPSQSRMIDLALPGKLQSHEKIKDIYSGAVKTPHVPMFIAGDNGAGFALQPSPLRIQIPNKEGTKVLSLGVSSLSVSSLRPYEGWGKFKPSIEQALSAYYDLTGFLPVVRIGVRYVNRIVIGGPVSDLSLYLSDVKTRNDSLDARLTHFNRRNEYLFDNGMKVVITQATLTPSNPEHTELFLDIDAIWDAAPLTNFDSVISKANELHSLEGKVFEHLINDGARSIFDAE